MRSATDGALRTTWRSLAELVAPSGGGDDGDEDGDALRSGWAALAARAIEPNVFYGPAVAAAAAPLYGADVVVLLVHGPDGDLVGLLPLRPTRRRYGLPVAVVTGWSHPFGPLGTPLIDPADPAGVAGAMLDAVRARFGAAPLLLPHFPEDGPVAVAFDAALAARRGRVMAFDRHARAVLRRLASPGDPAAITDPRRKEHARQRRRLAEHGRLAFDLATEPDAVTAALADVLALETRGWKGRAGTAAAQTPGQQALVTAAVATLAAASAARVARLRLGDRTVAAGIVLVAGPTAWFWKTAYDEALARYSPGVLLTLDLSAALLDDPQIGLVDSCAVAGHPMIDRLWGGRRTLSDRLIGLDPGLRFALVGRLETTRRTARIAARRVRDAVRRRG